MTGHQDAYSPSVVKTAKKVLAFTQLPQGWCYGEGGSIPGKVVSNTLSILDFLRLRGCAKMNAFPDNDGTLLLTGYFKNGHVDIEVRTNGRFGLLAELNSGIEVIDLPDVPADQLFTKIVAAIEIVCPISDLYTHGITPSMSVGLRAQRFVTPPVVARQSLTRSVQKIRAATSVATYRASTTAASPVTQRFFSSSQNRNL